MRVPDELGQASNRSIVHALGMDHASIASVRIDWNENKVSVEVYVLNKQGDPILQDGAPITTFVEFPVYARRDQS